MAVKTHGIVKKLKDKQIFELIDIFLLFLCFCSIIKTYYKLIFLDNF